jgi:hypothetical protein
MSNQLDFLTDDMIDDLLGDTRTRGGYSVFLKKFAESKAKYIDVRSDATFKGKKTASLLNSFSQNAKKLKAADPTFPTLRVVKTKDDATVVVVNMDVYGAAASDEASESESE